LDEANLNDEFLAAGMIHNRLTGYNMVRDRFISGNARRGSGFFGQSPCDPCGPMSCDPCDAVSCDPCSPLGFGRRTGGGFGNGATRNAWVNYVGGGDTYGSWDITRNGVQVGSDLLRTSRTQFGLIFGHEEGKAERVNHFTNGRIDSEDTYFGFYAARVLRSGADARMVYNVGWQNFDQVRDYDHTRMMFDNPSKVFTTDFTGRTHELNFEFGKRFHNGVWSIRPFVATDFYSMRLNEATEKPVNAQGYAFPGLVYGKSTTTQLFVRPGFDIRLQGKRLTLNTGMSYAYDLRDETFETHVKAIGGPDEFDLPLRGTKMGGQILSYNINGDLKLGRNVSVFGGYDLQAVVDRSGGVMHAGHVGGAVRW
jgi:uncharacterized protein with beta-barrel porin domain